MSNRSTANYINQVLEHAERNNELKGTFIGIAKQIGYAAAGAGAGGLTAGPFGALMGTIGGAVMGYMNSTDYSSLFGVARDLSAENKVLLAAAVRSMVGSATLDDFTSWFSSLDHQRLFMDVLANFITKHVTGNSY